MGLWICPAVSSPRDVREEWRDSWFNWVPPPVGCCFGTHYVFSTKLLQNGLRFQALGLVGHWELWGYWYLGRWVCPRGGWWDFGTCDHKALLQGRRWKKISKTRDVFADGTIRRQILRRR